MADERPTGAGPRRDKTLADAEAKALGTSSPQPPSPPPAPASTPPATPSLFDRAKKALGFMDGGEVLDDESSTDSYKKGGHIQGPGTGTSDSIPAMLSDGEYVLPADTVKSVGVDNLDHLRETTHNPANRAGTSHGKRGFT